MYEEPKPVNSEQPVKPVEYAPTPAPAAFQPPVQVIAPKKKSASSKIILHIFMILILGGGSAAGAYWWRDKTGTEFKDQQAATITSLESQLVTEKAKTSGLTVLEDGTTCTAVAPAATVIESIKSSITSGNTAALEGYMAASVNYILAASEGIGPTTAASAVSNITSFISDATSPWDFALSDAVRAGYANGGYEQYFLADSVIGKSADGKVISFSFDCDAKISTVFVAVSDELIAL